MCISIPGFVQLCRNVFILPGELHKYYTTDYIKLRAWMELLVNLQLKFHLQNPGFLVNFTNTVVIWRQPFQKMLYTLGKYWSFSVIYYVVDDAETENNWNIFQSVSFTFFGDVCWYFDVIFVTHSRWTMKDNILNT